MATDVLATGFLAFLVFALGCASEPPVGAEADPAARTDTRNSESPARALRETAERDAGTSSETDSDEDLAQLLLSDEDREYLQPTSDGAPPQASLTSDGDPRTAAEFQLAGAAHERAVATAGFRKLEGRHVTIYTDAPPRFALEELPNVFDAAVPLWCEYFGIDPAKVADWKMVGYHIVAKERHEQAGLFPANLPPFLHGFQRDGAFWFYEQPSDYYRRHLMLHEGVHGFMMAMLGGTGPPWYREGMAEYLATHRWQRHALALGIVPASREAVPYWGRVKVIQDEFAAGRGMMLNEVMRFDQSAHLRLEPYAWCWAAVAFLDGHPVYRNRFRQLIHRVTDTSAFFTRDFEAGFAERRRQLDEEWQLFVVGMDYGYDFVRNRVRYGPGSTPPGSGQSVIVAADRSWQSTRLRLTAGKTYLIRASGRYQVKQTPDIWWCEPGGITLEYAQGLPLGMLVGNIRLDEAQPGVANLATPIPVGKQRRFRAEGTGTLYLRINEHVDGWADNQGQLTVTVSELVTTTGEDSPLAD